MDHSEGTLPGFMDHSEGTYGTPQHIAWLHLAQLIHILRCLLQQQVNDQLIQNFEPTKSWLAAEPRLASC
uniref:Uncharacterized protein n=1 Tax=Nelumbo nucifera TaxID=4432 RepID=A0A822Z778_NELNU|nr:TPA_asm: hypothetical protein HUJ06_008020 [Nelumbo nucifera]